MTVFLFLQQREQERLQARQVLFDVRRDHTANRGARLDSFQAVVQARQRDGDASARFAERQRQFTFRVDRIDRHDDAAGFPDAELPDDELGTIRKHESDAIALADAVRGELGRESRAQAVELTERDDGALEEERWMLRPITRRLGDGVNEGGVRVRLERGWNAFVVVLEPGLADHHCSP